MGWGTWFSSHDPVDTVFRGPESKPSKKRNTDGCAQKNPKAAFKKKKVQAVTRKNLGVTGKQGFWSLRKKQPRLRKNKKDRGVKTLHPKGGT